MNRLFVVRHGNTFGAGETARRIGSSTDLPLVPSGIEQARTLGRLFRGRGISFTRALAGPLARTCQTASLILAEMVDAPTLEIADWLAEIDHGPDENRTEAEVVARISHAALHRWDTAAAPPPGWRVGGPGRIAAWRDLMANAPTGDTLLITSNGAARFALLAIGGASSLPSMKLATGAFGILTRNGSVRHGAADWSVEAWNTRDLGEPA